MLSKIKNLNFQLFKYSYETKLSLSIASINITETEMLNEDIILNE